MGAAADATLQRRAAGRPELRLTLLGLTRLDRSPVLRHAAAAGGRLEDAHTHYDALDTAVVFADGDGGGAARIVISAQPSGRSFRIDHADTRPSMVAVEQALASMFPRSASAYALLTRIGGGYRLPTPTIVDSRLRRWGTDTTYPVFELLPEGGLDQLLRHPEILDDWNFRGSVPLSMLRFYDRDRLPELTGRLSGPSGDNALTVALQLVYRGHLVDARHAADDIVAATGHPRAALQLLDQLNRTGEARKLKLTGFRDTAIAVLQDNSRTAR